MLPVLVIWDFLSPGALYPIGTDGTTVGRAAATFINANRAGEAMLLTFVLAIPVLRPSYRAALLLLLGAGVIVTFSRAAYCRLDVALGLSAGEGRWCPNTRLLCPSWRWSSFPCY